MDMFIRVFGLGRSARNKAGMKLRQPLSLAKVVAEEPKLRRLQRFRDLIKDELNLKELILTSDKGEVIEHAIRLRADLLGRKYGRLLPKLAAAITQMDAASLVHELQQSQTVKLKANGRLVTLLAKELEVLTKPQEGYAVAEEQEILVGLNIVVTEGLKKEGLARDIVRRIQNQRKDAGFEIADKIKIYYAAGAQIADAFTIYGDYISAETLAAVIEKAEPPEEAHVADYTIDGENLLLGLVRV